MQFCTKYGIIKSEQKRIVAKLEELLPFCERLKSPWRARGSDPRGSGIARLVFDELYDPSSPHTDVREYCKSNTRWETMSELEYELSDEIVFGP